MANLVFKRLIPEDFDAKDQNLINKLAFTLNPALSQLARVLSNGLSISNLNAQVKTISISVDSSGVPKGQLAFTSTLSDVSQGMQVVNAQNQTNSKTYPTSCPFISYQEANGVFTVTNITGLTADDTWQLTVIVYG